LSNNRSSLSYNWFSISIAACIWVISLHDLLLSSWSSNWCFSNSNRGCSWSRLSINMVDREISCSNSEAQSISNIVDSLDNAISINIAVSTTNYSISSFDFLLHRVAIRVSK